MTINKNTAKIHSLWVPKLIKIQTAVAVVLNQASQNFSRHTGTTSSKKLLHSRFNVKTTFPVFSLVFES